MRSSVLTLVLGAGSCVTAAACPFQLLKRAGILTDTQLKAFEAVQRDPGAAEELFQKHHEARDTTVQSEERNAEPEPQLLGGVLTPVLNSLGGGLLNGVLQPFTGILKDLDIPTPQEVSLKEIPGDDPDHQFEYPGSTDVRGLCPTLNTLANHAYIDRSGITTFAEAADACQIGYGFGYDLCTVLSALGLIAGGDLVTGKYSIGGADSRVPNTLGPALGLDKHGTFEIDNSITREDTYFGNQANFVMDRWKNLVAITDKYGGLFGEQTFIEEKGVTYDESRATNPEFFAGAKWFIVAHAERAFVYRALPNGTALDVPDFKNIAPFFLNETFPDEWYRRPSAYSVVNLVTDIVDLYLGSPRELGANEGLNNFVPLGVDLTAMTVPEIGCFIVQNVLDVIPGQVQPLLVDNIDVYSSFVSGAILPFFSSFDCDLNSYITPSASAGENIDASTSDSGPVIVNGVYQASAP